MDCGGIFQKMDAAMAYLQSFQMWLEGKDWSRTMFGKSFVEAPLSG